MWNGMVVVEKTKREKIVSHQLGVSTGYGDAHQLMLMQEVGIVMQQMHLSYKCMKAQQKKLSGCASNLLAHEDLGHFEEAHHSNIQAKFYNENFPLVYESDITQKKQGATLKHNI